MARSYIKQYFLTLLSCALALFAVTAHSAPPVGIAQGIDDTYLTDASLVFDVGTSGPINVVSNDEENGVEAALLPLKVGTGYFTPTARSGCSNCGLLSYPTPGPSLFFAADSINAGIAVFYYAVTDKDDGSTDIFTDCFTDSLDNSCASITIKVNGAPTAVDDTYTVDEGSSLSISAAFGVMRNDSDPNSDELNVELVSAPSQHLGVFTLNADGSFNYFHNGSETLNDAFSYRLFDGRLSKVATVNLVITPTNDAPTLTVSNLAASEDGSPVSAMSSYTDPDVSDSHAFSVSPMAPGEGSVSIDSTTGEYTFTPGFDFQELAQDATIDVRFAVTITDGEGGSDTQTVIVTVTGTNDAPVIDDQTVTVPENSASDTFVLKLQATDIDQGDSEFSYAIIEGLSIPVEFRVNSMGELLVGAHSPATPLLNFETTPAYSLTLKVTDKGGQTDTATILINLTNEPDAPGMTVCEEFDEAGMPLNTLPGYLGPLLKYYDFSAATPCHRVISTTDDYHMEQDKRLVAVSPLPTPPNSTTTNYRQLLSQIPKAWDEDSTLLYYSPRQNITDLLATVAFTNESGTASNTGEFIYLPPAGTNVTENGLDNFVYRVCDAPGTTSEARCALGVVYIDIAKKAAAAVNKGNVVDSGTLSQGPLELPVPALPNVFVLLDDSEAMASDILTDQSEGYYALGNQTKTWFLPEDGTNHYAPSEAQQPGQGLWRLRNKDYNKVYYNPGTTYSPWIGLNNRGEAYVAADPTNAISDPYKTASRKINLTIPQDMPGQDRDVLLPKYYHWTDIDDPINCPNNIVGVVDGTSPATFPDGICTEGTLVTITPATSSYPKGPARTDCAGATCSYAEEIQNFANFYSYSRTRHFTAKTALGVVVANADNMRIGFGAFGGTSDNIDIREMNESPLTGNKGALLTHLYRNSAASNSTPIRDSLERTGNYFECTGNNTIITSGATCPVLPAPEGNCQQNFSLIVTAGFWNGNTAALNTGNADGDNNSPWDHGRYAQNGAITPTLADIAMHFYERDLHPALSDEVPATARDLAGAAALAFGGSNVNPTMHQHLSTYVIAFGVAGSLTLADVPTDYTSAFDWGDVVTDDDKLNDLVHTAVNGRGDYLNADNPNALKSALDNAFSQFARAIGTASAVSFNSQEVQHESLLYRAIYNVRDNTGDLLAQRFNPDGTLGSQVWSAAEQLDLKDPTAFQPTVNRREILTYDKSVANGARGIAFRPQTIVERNQQLAEALEDDLLGVLDWDPVFDPATSPTPDLFDQQMIKHINYLRGDSSHERPAGNLRERPLIKGRLGDIVSSTPVFYATPDRARRTLPPYPTVAAESYEAFKASFTNLSETDDKARTPMVYVGANDGFLHGFNANTGEEHFAYLPGEMITGVYSQRIKQLLSTDYAHRYSVDLAAAVNDVYLDPDRRRDTGTVEKDWTTLLIGGYRAGGKGYFALDITDPTGANDASKAITEANASRVVMWEFTALDDTPVIDVGVDVDADMLVAGDSDDRSVDALGQPISDLGYSFSTPTIAISNVSEATSSAASGDRDNRWIAVLGNGYDSTSGNAALFVLFVDGGTDGEWCHPEKAGCAIDNGAGDGYDFVKITAAGRSATGIANGLGTPRGIDLDGNGTLDIAYAGDRFGNLFRFDLRNPDPAAWHSTLLYSASYTDAEGTTFAQPITTQPLVIAHPTIKTGVNCAAFDANEVLSSNLCGGYIVIFSTGSYIYEDDDTNRNIQSIYGIWDRLGSTLVTQQDLVQQTYTAFTGDAKVGAGRVLSTNPVDYATRFGWYLNFDNPAAEPIMVDGIAQAEYPGERAIRNIQLRGGIVFVNSVIPKAALSCSVEAGGAANAFCPDTGSTSCITRKGIFDINKDSLINELDLTETGNYVASTYFEGSVPTDSTFFGDTLVTQLSDQTLKVVATDTAGGVHTGRISWSQLKTD